MQNNARIEREKLEKFSRNWLLGSTCYRQTRSVRWASEDNRFVLMKHHGHTEYVDRMCGSQYCETFYALYDITKPMPDAFGRPYMWKVEGRFLKSHWVELKRIVEQAS